ncbi:MAG: 50S ribosomal protein L13 [Calditrichaeota bacterium]|nr:MAG: 50S ribosomal protein L13 [Calditrichota bacterium]
MKTYVPKPEDIDRKWYVVDAKDKVLGRLASQVATILRGKHKPIYAPHMDVGDHVIIINADKIRVTGKKSQTKRYFRHSGYPGGVRFDTFAELIQRHPERILEKAVWGMLPHNKLGRKMFKKLKVYAGENHPHQAQKPEKLELK